ncbi:YbhB/YbcL family Raf kinase inhibitor-like protein [Pleomorphomonas diazotrophica]|uniref:YbhB/YbcL family Raf kinase inhibitor-like protein n=1 Tax=Pleomorphomonas diazotrophica TaxID=1166257 RepID=A0A1I4S6N6_9HYPH|nr:YbhB/YbcL family Raf kinase inhibitor-like protein [Pleomorphomonas diazotrophica]PKR89919.1 YbhB/YbcL family Raf kinase inhibitor-like protein [Pleomorphomonas diazotrophica]SFM59954.1 Raf kinase inhibitor-like protein, YbhB/YbcL family [Pleomorphomonas diazotrophica]
MRTGYLGVAPLVLVLVLSAPVMAQQGDGTDVSITSTIFKPNKVQPTSERLDQLKAPEGFSVQPFAQGLGNARIIAVSDKGFIYVSRREEGDVLLLKDEDGDGKADSAPVKVASRAQAHGLAVKDDRLYLATVKEVFVAPIQPDGRLGPLDMIIGDLPDAGQHPNRVLAFGPDDMLYISVGSTCNACNESNAENATILRATPDGKSRIIFASGLRNTIGFDWSPETGELWGFDHGIDFLGDEVQPEELNRIEAGKQYGWPHVHGEGGFNPQSTPPGGISKEQWRDMSTPMVLGYTAHAAPMQFKFYTGAAFPADYAGDAFATMRGSWNRNPASGYEIVRVRFENGQPTAIEPFVTGFLTDGGKTHIARPVGLVVAKDGSLLMADDTNGVIYRVAYQGHAETTAAAKAPPAGPMETQATQGVGVPLAKDRPETTPEPSTSTLPLVITSASFAEGGAIPLEHSEYADGVSPQLSWTEVPGAASYAIIMEDPDAKPITPFVHWVAWNIPAAITALPEGLQEQMRLTEPEGVLQGRNSSGRHGYLGPKPPVGDPPHHYHFQVLALDALLDLPPTADRDAVLAAAKGHVLAKGTLVGIYQQHVEPPK